MKKSLLKRVCEFLFIDLSPFAVMAWCLVVMLVFSYVFSYKSEKQMYLVSHINVKNYYKEVHLKKGYIKGDTVIVNQMPFIVQ